jgi:hypothetical protein
MSGINIAYGRVVHTKPIIVVNYLEDTVFPSYILLPFSKFPKWLNFLITLTLLSEREFGIFYSKCKVPGFLIGEICTVMKGIHTRYFL